MIINSNFAIGYAFENSLSNITDVTSLSNVSHITGNLRIQIDELSENVKILPVVVKDAFNLEMDHPFKGEVQVRLYTLNGAIVKTESYHKSHPVLSKNMEVSYLPGGVYVVNIHFDTFVITKKIVKK